MRCCDCEFRNTCDESEIVLTSFCSCEKRNRLLGKSKADQMFRELGYHHFLGCAKKVNETVFTREIADNISEEIIVEQKKKMIFKCVYHLNVGFTYDEILACAQLIKEMEENHG